MHSSCGLNCLLCLYTLGSLLSLVAYKLVNFVNDKFVDPEGARIRKGLPAKKNAPQVTSPYPHINIPPMDPSQHSLSEIFASVLHPLTEFDRVADEFVDRKHAAQSQYDAYLLRKKTSNVPSSEARSVESAVARIETEERTHFRPRLEYLSELYYRRSSELMERTQSLAEQRVEVGKAAQGTREDKERQRLQAIETATREAQDKEMADFQALSQKNQHLLGIVRKYDLRSPEGNSIKRHMQIQQIKQSQEEKKAQQPNK